jgi:hypothetical protein
MLGSLSLFKLYRLIALKVTLVVTKQCILHLV